MACMLTRRPAAAGGAAGGSKCRVVPGSLVLIGRPHNEGRDLFRAAISA